MDCSSPGSSVHGTSISYVSCLAGRFFTTRAALEVYYCYWSGKLRDSAAPGRGQQRLPGAFPTSSSQPPPLLQAKGKKERVDFLCSSVQSANCTSSSESFEKVLITRQVMTDVSAARGRKLQKCHPGLGGPQLCVPPQVRPGLHDQVGLPLSSLCFPLTLCPVSFGGALKVI